MMINAMTCGAEFRRDLLAIYHSLKVGATEKDRSQRQIKDVHLNPISKNNDDDRSLCGESGTPEIVLGKVYIQRGLDQNHQTICPYMVEFRIPRGMSVPD